MSLGDLEAFSMVNLVAHLHHQCHTGAVLSCVSGAWTAARAATDWPHGQRLINSHCNMSTPRKGNDRRHSCNKGAGSTGRGGLKDERQRAWRTGVPA